MTTPLQPCPFCGCNNIGSPRVKDGYAWIKCVRCGSLGPTKESLDAAIMAWNTRADVGQFVDIKAFCEKADNELASRAAQVSAAVHRNEYLEEEVIRLKAKVEKLTTWGDVMANDRNTPERLRQSWLTARNNPK